MQLTVFVSFACLCVLIQGQDTMALRYLFQIAIKQAEICAEAYTSLHHWIQFSFRIGENVVVLAVLGHQFSRGKA